MEAEIRGSKNDRNLGEEHWNLLAFGGSKGKNTLR